MISNFPLRRKVLACSVGLILGTAISGMALADNTENPFRTGMTLIKGETLPTGKRITPEAARFASFQPLNPDLSTRPDFMADHAVDTVISPDGKTLLILTSGYNRNNGADGSRVPGESNEYVFVYDISGANPLKKQVIQIPNTFNGVAWNPRGDEFYVTGGVDDNVHVYHWDGSQGTELTAIPLGHNDQGQGRSVRPLAAGLAVNAGGSQLLVANYENDSISLIDLNNRSKIAELDLRPGKTDPVKQGMPGGTYPLDIAFKGDNKAYVSSQRDRELVVVGLSGNQLHVEGRIKTRGQPNKMTLNKVQDRLYVASDNSDTVLVVDTLQDRVIEEILTIAPKEFFPNSKTYKGANPNNVALSPDEGTLFVTNGGTNSVAVIQLGHALAQDEDEDDDGDSKGKTPAHGDKIQKSRVIGLIPTGWYPNAVAVKPDGSALYVVNGKSNTGPNPKGCRNTVSIASGSLNGCNAENQYVWQLEKAGFLTLPVPDAKDLVRLTWQVAYNNSFPAVQDHQKWESTMAFLRSRIKHVIYIVKENRTYDQIHGDLGKGNGDPSLAILSPYSPNHNKLAREFVILDNFYDSGETSGVGWNWSTAARTTDFTEKTQPVNYAGRGLSYDWEGANRNVAVSLPTVAERKVLDPDYPDDPDLLPGTADVAAPDSHKGEAGTGYLWDAALRAGLGIRNYGFYVQNINAVTASPYEAGIKQAVALKQALAPYTDEYFRGYDQNNADFYLFREWEREFDGYVQNKNLPNLSFVRFPHDHFGNFGTAQFGVNTVETQMADNDYAVGRLVEKVAKSPYKDNTLIFVIEDDAQNGGDHVDAHRSIAYIVGPYVKQGALVSTHYTTVSLVRTIEEVLGLEPLGINDGLTAPMADVFDTKPAPKQKPWDYQAVVAGILCDTELNDIGNDLPQCQDKALIAASPTSCHSVPVRDAAYWTAAMQGQDFSIEDRLDEEAFNRALWAGLKGEQVPYPNVRHGHDLKEGRAALLKAHFKQLARECDHKDAVASAK